MLRVVCCYVNESTLRPETEHGLVPRAAVPIAAGVYVAEGSRVHFVAVGEDLLAYGRVISMVWRDSLESGEDVAFVEQDIEVGPSTIYDFRACQHPYCAAPYPWSTAIGAALGCTRFRAEFIAAHPHAVDEAIDLGGGHFRQFDVIFQRRVLAKRYGAQPHVHAPVIHHNEAKRLRPDASPVPLEGVPINDIGELL